MPQALTPEEEHDYQRGLEAEALLALPMFANLIVELTRKNMADLLTTEDDATGPAERERIYYRHQGLVAVEDELRSRVAVKNGIKLHLDSEPSASES